MHEEVFSDPKIAKLITEKFYVIQMNLFGDEEVTDFDSETLTEKEMAIKWGVHFTPTIMFFPVESDVYKPANLAAVMTMPGAFSKYTTFNLLNFILEEGYNGSEHFQKYHSRKYLEQKLKNCLNYKKFENLLYLFYRNYKYAHYILKYFLNDQSN